MVVVVGAVEGAGAAVVAALTAARIGVRAVVQNHLEWELLQATGVEAVVADSADGDSLRAAFTGCDAGFLMDPPNCRGGDTFACAHKAHRALVEAANAAGLSRIVALSSIGAQRSTGTGSILLMHDFENQLARCRGRVTVLRSATLMEHWLPYIPHAIWGGTLFSMFSPLDRGLPMVAASDVGTTAACLLMDVADRPLISLAGPSLVSPVEAAASLSRLIAKDIRAVPIREADRERFLVLELGLPTVTATALAEMFAGLNSGLIAFEGREEKIYGATTFEKSLTSQIMNVSLGYRSSRRCPRTNQ